MRAISIREKSIISFINFFIKNYTIQPPEYAPAARVSASGTTENPWNSP